VSTAPGGGSPVFQEKKGRGWNVKSFKEGEGKKVPDREGKGCEGQGHSVTTQGKKEQGLSKKKGGSPRGGPPGGNIPSSIVKKVLTSVKGFRRKREEPGNQSFFMVEEERPRQWQGKKFPLRGGEFDKGWCRLGGEGNPFLFRGKEEKRGKGRVPIFGEGKAPSNQRETRRSPILRESKREKKEVATILGRRKKHGKSFSDGLFY